MPPIELKLELAQQEHRQVGAAKIAVAGGVNWGSCQVSTRGTKESRIWTFVVKTSEPILEG